MVDKDRDELGRADEIVDSLSIEVTFFHGDRPIGVAMVQHLFESLGAN